MEAALNSPYGRTVIGPAPLKIGRAPDNSLVISDPQSSAHHLEIASNYSGNGYQVTDLNSTNGTFVNEQRLTANMPHPLNANDVLRIGNTLFNYEVSGSSYAPTIAAGLPNYEATVAASPGMFAPPTPQPPVTPPPLYPQPSYQAQPPYVPGQPAYPQPGYPQPSYPQPAYPQPAYPQPGGFGQPGYAQPKKSRTGLVVAIIVILLLVVGGGGGAFYYFQIRATPQKTLSAYCDGWKTSNAQELYNQLDAAQQAKTSVSDIQQALSALTVLGGVKNCTVSNVQQSGSTATGVVQLTFGNGKAETVTDALIQENGTWKIAEQSSNGDS